MTRTPKRPTPTKPTRAVGYVRISVDRCDESSTASQEKLVRAYCKRNELRLVDVIVEPGRSAYRSSRRTRPGFERAKELIRSGAADLLVVWKLDRACRSTIDTLQLVEELAEYGAELVSVTESFDSGTASGRMTLSVLAALAEMESSTKSERSLAWQEHRRNSGATPTGPRPFGYKREHNKLHIVEGEAKVIRAAADALLAGKGLNSIVVGLKGKSGKPLTRRGLRTILLSPTIAACRETSPGVFVASKEWKPILTRAKWDKVRAVLNDPSRRTTSGPGRRWLLSGIAVCSRDDTPLGVQSSRYTCPRCQLSIEVERTDEIVVGDLLALLDPKAWRRLRRGVTGPVTGDSAAYEQAMSELTDRHKAGDIDGAELGTLADALRRQQESPVTQTVQLPDVDDLECAWPKLSLEAKRLVITTATESLTIKPFVPNGGTFDEKRIVFVPVA